MDSSFELVLFSVDPIFIPQAVAAGVRAIIVDWENINKRGRQCGFDTQINHDTIEDLRRVRASTNARVLCRLNSFGVTTAVEIEQAISAGADELLLPMVRTIEEVEIVLSLVAARCGVGILIETEEAVALAARLNLLPLTRAYVGLNDLAIQRGSPSIFTALVDGTVERLSQIISLPFGFGGLTLPDCGSPIPCQLLIGEMARLGCQFSFLRRSFHRDIQSRQAEAEIPNLLKALRQAKRRSDKSIAEERQALHSAVLAYPNFPVRQKGPYHYEKPVG